MLGHPGDGETAIIEMAAASGLPLVPAAQRNPCLTTTFGTGELIKAALDAGLQKIIIGIGGSATNDGGVGMARALGARFSSETGGAELPEGGAALLHLKHIDLNDLDPRLEHAEITVACDVNNPLCGSRGASAVFGRSKVPHRRARPNSTPLWRTTPNAPKASPGAIYGISGCRSRRRIRRWATIFSPRQNSNPALKSF